VTPISVKLKGNQRLAFVVDFKDEDTHFPHLHEQAMKLREEGLSPKQIALKLRMKKGTVADWCYRGTQPRGRKAGYVILIRKKWYHICDPNLEFYHPDWEEFTTPEGEEVFIVPSKMNTEVDNVNRKF